MFALSEEELVNLLPMSLRPEDLAFLMLPSRYGVVFPTIFSAKMLSMNLKQHCRHCARQVYQEKGHGLLSLDLLGIHFFSGFLPWRQ